MDSNAPMRSGESACKIQAPELPLDLRARSHAIIPFDDISGCIWIG